MVEFAGWALPVMYDNIAAEHAATRTSGGLFDVSHMGRLRFKGGDAGAFLEKVFTRRVTDLAAGRSRYGFITNEVGGVKDDVIVSAEGDHKYAMVCNASNRQKLLAHFEAVAADHGWSIGLEDRTEKTAMVALQGPSVIEKLADKLPVDIDLRDLKRFGFVKTTYLFMEFIVHRTGYTGEDGVEVILPARAAAMAVKALGGESAWLKPAGLGARDTLRVEAGLPLYGHELSEEISALASGYDFAINLDQDFIGAPALRQQRDAGGPPRRLVGLKLDAKRIARQHTPVRLDGEVVGQVTSGTLSPTLGSSIAIAHLDAAHTEVGTKIECDFRGKPIAAEVVAMPFYKRA